MHRDKLDAIDLELLRALQEHGRTKRSELAEKVALTIPSVSARLDKLEKAGVIAGYHAVLDPHHVGLEVTALIFLESESSRFFPQIVERARATPEVLECHAITGEGSHLLKARTQSTVTLERLLSDIQSWPGVVNTRTSVVLSSPKETRVLPLDHLQVGGAEGVTGGET